MMAEPTVAQLTDDLQEGVADRRVTFALDGVSYSIEVTEEWAGHLRASLQPFMNAGTKVGTGGLRRNARRRSGPSPVATGHAYRR